MTSPSNDGTDDRRTPRELFDALHAQYHFTVDAAASAENALLPRFWTKETPACWGHPDMWQGGGLAQDWSEQRVWCNPPFSNLAPWVKRAHLSRATPLIVMLVPANRTEQGWWHEYIEPYRDRPGSPLTVEFLKGRVKFGYPESHVFVKGNRPPFGVCLLKWART
jgi:phage N-6-adenine-methyltransferase